MIYKAKNIDTDKFLEQIKNLEEFNREIKQREKTAVEKYHEGYEKALYDIKDMFYCSNYEKKEEKTNG